MNANRRTRIAENRIHTDPAHPSRLILPVIPGP
jgi:predicted acyl esterase